MKRLIPEVAEKVNRPFPVKFKETRDTIAQRIEEFGDKVAVAFSGGKDSEVVLYLCLQQKPDIEVIFHNSGVEYPETLSIIKRLKSEWNLNLKITHPLTTFWEIADRYGLPYGSIRGNSMGRKIRCCYHLKEKPMYRALIENGWLAYFAGVTAIESSTRMFTARDKGICFLHKHWDVYKIYPILWWNEEEVWEFIKENNLPYNELYDKGMTRTGCMTCTAYKDWEKRMSVYNPKLYKMLKERMDKQLADIRTSGGLRRFSENGVLLSR